MKKSLFILCACLTLATITGCTSNSKETIVSETPSSEETPKPTEETTVNDTDPPTVNDTEAPAEENQTGTKTAKSIAETLSNKLDGENVIDMAGDLIGAIEGASFTLNGNKFEIYKFDDKSKLEEAESGKLKITIEGFGDYEMNSVVNGDYVLLFDTKNSKVTKLFLSE